MGLGAEGDKERMKRALPYSGLDKPEGSGQTNTAFVRGRIMHRDNVVDQENIAEVKEAMAMSRPGKGKGRSMQRRARFSNAERPIGGNPAHPHNLGPPTGGERRNVPIAQSEATRIRDRLPSTNALRGLSPNISEMYEERASLAMWSMTHHGAQAFMNVAHSFEQNGAQLNWDAIRDWFYYAMVGYNAYWCSKEVTAAIVAASRSLERWTLSPDLFSEPRGVVWFERPLTDELPVVPKFDLRLYSGSPSGQPPISAEGRVSIQGFAWVKVYEWDSHPDWPIHKMRYHYTSTDRQDVIDTMKKMSDGQGGGAITERVTFFMFGRDPEDVHTVEMQNYHWRMGITNDEMFGHLESNDAMTEFDRVATNIIGAFLLWINQKILVTESSADAHRAAKRRVELLMQSVPDGQRIHVSEVKVVTLRAIKRVKVREGEEPEPVDWSCRWMVRGHWRNQWYPSLGIHQAKFIGSYIKGPEDKALRLPKAQLFTVVR